MRRPGSVTHTPRPLFRQPGPESVVGPPVISCDNYRQPSRTPTALDPGLENHPDPNNGLEGGFEKFPWGKRVQPHDFRGFSSMAKVNLSERMRQAGIGVAQSYQSFKSPLSNVPRNSHPIAGSNHSYTPSVHTPPPSPTPTPAPQRAPRERTRPEITHSPVNPFLGALQQQNEIHDGHHIDSDSDCDDLDLTMPGSDGPVRADNSFEGPWVRTRPVNSDLDFEALLPMTLAKGQMELKQLKQSRVHISELEERLRRTVKDKEEIEELARTHEHAKEMTVLNARKAIEKHEQAMRAAIRCIRELDDHSLEDKDTWVDVLDLTGTALRKEFGVQLSKLHQQRTVLTQELNKALNERAAMSRVHGDVIKNQRTLVESQSRMEEQLAGLKSEGQSLSQQQMDGLQKDRSALQQECENLRARLEQSHSNKDAQTNTIAMLGADLKIRDQRIERLEEQLNQFVGILGALGVPTEIIESNADRALAMGDAQLQQLRSRHAHEVQDVTQQLAGAREDLERSRQALSKAQADVAASESRYHVATDHKQEEVARLQRIEVDMRKKIEQLQTQEQCLRAENLRLDQERKIEGINLENVAREVSALHNQHDVAVAKVEELNSKVINLKIDNAKLSTSEHLMKELYQELTKRGDDRSSATHQEAVGRLCGEKEELSGRLKTAEKEREEARDRLTRLESELAERITACQQLDTRTPIERLLCHELTAGEVALYELAEGKGKEIGMELVAEAFETKELELRAEKEKVIRRMERTQHERAELQKSFDHLAEQLRIMVQNPGTTFMPMAQSEQDGRDDLMQSTPVSAPSLIPRVQSTRTEGLRSALKRNSSVPEGPNMAKRTRFTGVPPSPPEAPQDDTVQKMADMDEGLMSALEDMPTTFAESMVDEDRPRPGARRHRTRRF
ncbi:hypothetical protein M231_01986 [Tremella mesenterica]|uniref:Uncharacterized protein n=1 Tax=Tremella mesenterica TaxID=5217 RepID=A0A4Q1BRW9_TREME|nr:hypothetical protein M231_01986 [Tremella mesenterica]